MEVNNGKESDNVKKKLTTVGIRVAVLFLVG